MAFELDFDDAFLPAPDLSTFTQVHLRGTPLGTQLAWSVLAEEGPAGSPASSMVIQSMTLPPVRGAYPRQSGEPTVSHAGPSEQILVAPQLAAAPAAWDLAQSSEGRVAAITEWCDGARNLLVRLTDAGERVTLPAPGWDEWFRGPRFVRGAGASVLTAVSKGRTLVLFEQSGVAATGRVLLDCVDGLGWAHPYGLSVLYKHRADGLARGGQPPGVLHLQRFDASGALSGEPTLPLGQTLVYGFDGAVRAGTSFVAAVTDEGLELGAGVEGAAAWRPTARGRRAVFGELSQPSIAATSAGVEVGALRFAGTPDAALVRVRVR